MAKKIVDWETVAKDKEVLARAEALVKEGAAKGGTVAKEISDFDLNKARQASEPEMPSLFGASAPEGEMTREFLEENWVVSSYDEGEECQMDYYMHEMSCFPGEKAYCYSHEDDELRELEIVHVIARMDNASLYDELMQDEDVLINGEEEYGADCSAEFTGMFSCYLMWFKEV